MPAEAKTASLGVPELQRQVEALADQLRSQREECDEALQREAAIAEILRAINEPDADLARVFDVLIEKATQLCSASYGYVWLYDGERTRAVAAFAQQPFRDWLRDREPLVPPPQSPLGEAILHRRLVHVVDAREHEAYKTLPAYRELMDRGGIRTLLHVPLRKGQELRGFITVYRQERQPFSDRQIALLEGFAAQAVMAIENARLLSQQREALEQQKATSEVLGVISSSPEELEPVFSSILSNAIRLCGAEFGNLFLYKDNAFHLGALHGASPAYAAAWQQQPVLSIENRPHFPLARLAATKQVVHIADLARERTDLESDPRYITLFESARARTMLLVPMLREDELVGAIVIYAPEVRPFDDKHIDLVVSFAKQAVIAIENSRLLRQLRERTRDLEEALEQQTATSDVLQVISRSTFDLQPVLQTLAETAIRLCRADMCYVLRHDGEAYRAVTVAASSPEALDDARAHQRYLEAHPLTPGRGSITGRVALTGQTVHVTDVAADPEYTITQTVTLGRIHTQVGVPLMREGTMIGVIVLSRQRVDPFSERQVALARTFADQAVIAIENTRLLTEQREALEQQTATAEILRVISTTPADPQPVFEMIVRSAVALCGGLFANVFRFDGELVHFVASHNTGPDYLDLLRSSYPMRPDHSQVSGRVLLTRSVVRLADALADPDYDQRFPRALGWRRLLGMPMLRDGEVLGVIVVGWAEAGPVPRAQEELLKTFADQAVVAIENARLLAEQREALDQQTATAEVLEVINFSPGNLVPVFDAMLEKAMRLCEAAFGGLWTFDRDKYVATALRGVPAPYAAFLANATMVPGPGTGPDRLKRGEPVVHNVDLAAEDAYLSGDPQRRALVDLGGARSALQVPLRKDDDVLGVITIYRQEVRPFTDNQIALLQNFAAQGVIAIENARLITETREALEQQTATAEVLQAINSSPGDLAPVFETILEKAHALCGVALGSLQLYDGTKFRAVAVHSLPEPLARRLREGYVPVANFTGRLIDGADFAHFPDVGAIDDPMARATAEGGIGTLLTVALRKDGKLLGQIVSARREVRPFTDKEISLLQSFAAQAVIAMENARLLTEQREALEQQTATAEVLQTINSSPGDLMPVFDAMLEKAMRLCAAAFGYLMTFDGERFEVVAHQGLPPRFADYLRDIHQPSRIGLYAAVREGAAFAQAADLAEGEVYSMSPLRRALVDLGGARTGIVVALRKDDALLGVITIYRQEVRPFTDKEIALLQSFAAQAVIAMENARLLTEQREALEQQTATAEVLQVINSSPGDLAPVFDVMLEKAMRLCGATFGILRIYDGSLFHGAASRGVPAAYAEFLAHNPQRPQPGSIGARIVAGEPLVHVIDVADDRIYPSSDPHRRALVELGGARTSLVVPLTRGGKLLGAVQLYRQHVQAFSEKQITLVQNFAAQAVIAMENARLINETREALEQQTATAEVLEIINSSPANLAPVFDAMLDRAVRLSESAFGIMNLYEDGRFNAVALRGVPPGLIEQWEEAPQPGPHNALSRLIAGEDVVHVADLAAYRSFLEGDLRSRGLVEVGGARSLLAVALRKEGKLVGTLTAYRQEVRPFSDKQIALLEGFAAQAVIAIENARLLEQLRDRQAELRVTFDNMGDGVVMFDGDHRLAAWNRNFQELIGLSQEWLARRPSYADYLGLLAERGEFGTENVEAELASRLEDPERELRLERTRPDGSVIEARRNAVPGGGFVLIYSDITERKRSEEKIRAARDVAENALKDLKTAQASLIHAEKMASLGQLTAGIAHEIKNPLNFVNNFAGLSMELLEELKESVAEAREALDEDRRAALDETIEMLNTNFEKIRNHGQRADGIVKSMLLHSRGGSSDRQMVDINAVLEEALNLAYHGARAQDQSFNVTLERDLQGDMAPIGIVPQDITRVFLNLIGNGFYAVAKRRRHDGETFRPTLKVTTRDLPDAVEIAIRDNGVGIPPQHRQRLFQPFFTTKPTGEGTGLGLSISYDIVTQQHGGTIVVDSAPGQFTEFTIRLPRRGPSAGAAGRPA